jgi:3-oxoacyl-[acyl-carrier protein] reductase
MRLAGLVAVVTGGGRGIGLGIATRLMREGAHVVINDRDAEALTRAEKTLAQTGDVRIFTADVSDVFQVNAMFEFVKEHWGRIDLLVNNAGLVDTERHFLTTDGEYWDRIIDTNLKGMFLCSRCAAEMMVRRRSGSIIHLSSVGAARAHRCNVAYDASKGGVEAATRAMALDLAPWGIRVNAVGPGAIRTVNWDHIPPAEIAQRSATIPLQRLGTPDDVAAVVAFLASSESTYITGQVIYVDGGLLAQLRSPQVDVPASNGP